MPFYAANIKTAQTHLRQADPVMKAIIGNVGPFTARARRDRFQTLVRSIISQQISGAAAGTILGRLEALVAPEKIRPETLTKFDVEALRAVGLSRQKATYTLDLANKVQAGVVDLKTMGRRDNESIIAELTQVKGIGIWTAQIFLMFSLARLDIIPTGDLGIQNAIKKHYKPRGKLSHQQIEKIAKPWRPYATIASWYLWRSLDMDASS